MSRRTYPVPNLNLSGGDYIQNKRAKQLFSGTSDLAKTIEEQNGNFPLLTPSGKLKPYQGTYGLSGRSTPNEKTYCLNTSHSYKDLLAITKGKYLITPPNIANTSTILLTDVSKASKLYNGLYYVYNYTTTNALAYMNPGYPVTGGYPTTLGSYVANQIEYSPTSDANQRIITDPSYNITYTSQSCILNNREGRGISINNDYDSKFSFNRTINLDLLTGFQYPVKFALDYDSGDCINANNDMQSKYANPVVPPPPPSVVYYNAGGLGTNQAIIAWSTDGVIWNASDNGNTIFNGAVRSIKYGEGTGLNFWVAVGNGINVVARSFDGKAWTASIPSNPLQNLNNILTAGYGVVPVLNPDVGVAIRWIVVGQGSTNTIAYSNNNAVVWNIASSTDPSLNNPFGIGGEGYAVATNNIDKIIAVGYGSYNTNPGTITMVQSSNGGLSWSVVNNTPFGEFRQPYTIIYGNSRWLAGGTANGSSLESPIYFSDNNGVNWQNASSWPPGGYGGTCIDIAYRGSSPNDGKANYVAVGDNLFEAFSSVSDIWYSINGDIWYPTNSTRFNIMQSVTYYAGVSGGTWVAVGKAEYFSSMSVSYYSTDGITWFSSPNFSGLFQNTGLSVGSVSGI
jgi:hypothetical protein